MTPSFPTRRSSDLPRWLALQLRFSRNSESMGLHGEETVDDGCIDRDDAGALGVIASGCEGADSGIVHARARGCFGGFVHGRVAWRRAAQDGLDARRGGG